MANEMSDMASNASSTVTYGAMGVVGTVLCGMLAVVYSFTNTVVTMIVGSGLILVVLLLLLYFWILSIFRKRKAAPMERALLDNSSASPTSISEPARRAKLDDMRKSFETGVKRFKDAGKNIYSLPWYALVGEPGSGKTEAIRHSKIGFPPGLQDQLQGAGGTLNMNWWFSNNAIILDTAGRLMFEEAPPGQTTEWKSFMDLLGKARPNCPINGLLLVIPCDALIRDSADQIERKAGKIARQFDSIQRSLGVRFPVFVVLTKADLLVGFREFFDNVTDPHLQDQMLGWSNPNPLDAPFNPAEVEKHLQSVSAALCKRRQGLLIDPVNTEDANARRLDQVDALYAFPESLQQLAPRLRRYLEMIFVSGEWAPKPLFLRGIYFNSAMREGSALDAALAEAMRVPLEALPEGKVWERDRSYFLRDLFLEKVFKERGLVTRANNTRQLQRRRKLVLMSTILFTVVVLGGLTFWGAWDLRKKIGGEQANWNAVKNAQQSPEAKESEGAFALSLFTKPGATTTSTTQKWKYLGDQKVLASGDPVELSSQSQTRASLLTSARELSFKTTPVSALFKPLEKIIGNINVAKKDAFATVFEDSLIRPMLDATRRGLDVSDTANWSPETTQALASAVRLETFAADLVPSSASKTPEPVLRLADLAPFILSDEELARFNKDTKAQQDNLDAVYGNSAARTTAVKNWSKNHVAGDKSHQETIARALRTLDDYCNVSSIGARGQLSNISALTMALRRMQTAEADLSLKVGAPVSLADYRSKSQEWLKSYAEFDSANKEADALCKKLKEAGWTDTQSLRDLFKAQLLINIGNSQKALADIRKQLPDTDASKTPAFLNDVRKSLADLDSRLSGLDADKVLADLKLKDDLDSIDAAYLKLAVDADNKALRLYSLKHQLATLAIAPIPSDDKLEQKVDLDLVATAFEKIDSELEANKTKVDEAAARNVPLKDKLVSLSDASSKILAYRAQYRRQLIAQDILVRMKPLEEGPGLAAKNYFNERAAAIAALPDRFPAMRHDAIPFTRFAKQGSFEPAFHRLAAKAVLSGWKAIDAAAPEDGKNSRVIEPKDIRQRLAALNSQYAAYSADYVEYWTTTINQQIAVDRLDWDDFMKQPFQSDAVLTGLLDINHIQSAALSDVAALVPEKQKTDIKAAAELVADPARTRQTTLQNAADRKYARWHSSTNPDAAKDAIIKLRPADFVSDYMLPPLKTSEPQPVYEAYFTQLFNRALESLSKQTQDRLRSDVKTALSYRRFPLAAPEAATDPLTVDDLAAARTVVARVSDSATPPQNVGPNAAIRDGGTTDYKDINELLKQLLVTDLSDAERGVIQKMSALMKVLPDKDKTTVTLSTINPDDWTNPLEGAGLKKDDDNWRFIAVYPLTKPENKKDEQDTGKRVGFGGDRIEESALPIDAIRIRFKQNPADRFLDGRALVFPAAEEKDRSWTGSWTPLRLIFLKGAVRLTDGAEWLVPIPTQNNSAVVIKLKFEKPLPKLDQWPTAPERR